MKRLYARCNGHDYFDVVPWNGYCPLDGWSSPESIDLAEAAKRLLASGQDLTVHALRQAGASEGALARAIVIEFGSQAFEFDAMTPHGLLVDHVWKTRTELDPHWL